jgi:hypothetical protein
VSKLLLLLTLLLSDAALAAAPLSASLTPAMDAAIQKAVPGAHVLAKTDIEPEDCGDDTPAQPGLVIADFQGKARQDFAVLLNAGDSGKVTEWEGKKLKLINFAFAIFLDAGDGTFAPKHVEKYQGYLPLSDFIDLQAPGKVDDVENGRKITIQHFGVNFIHCGKSAALYYLANQKIQVLYFED